MGKSKDKKTHSKRKSDVIMEDESSQVDNLKKKATVKVHGIENTQTFEHPASFTATTKQLDPNSLKHFIMNVDIKV